MPDKMSRLVSNPEEIETSSDTETAVLAVAVTQVAISDAEHVIISSQHNATRGHSGVEISNYTHMRHHNTSVSSYYRHSLILTPLHWHESCRFNSYRVHPYAAQDSSPPRDD